MRSAWMHLGRYKSFKNARGLDDLWWSSPPPDRRAWCRHVASITAVIITLFSTCVDLDPWTALHAINARDRRVISILRLRFGHVNKIWAVITFKNARDLDLICGPRVHSIGALRSRSDVPPRATSPEIGKSRVEISPTRKWFLIPSGL